MAASVTTDAVVPCRAEMARRRLGLVIDGPSAVRATVPIGPRAGRWPTKRVRADMTDLHDAGRTSVAGLRWTPTGSMHGIFPSLDAGIAVTDIDDTTCLLTIVGGYRPPFGRFGAVADRLFLHRLAVSTAAGFADRLARSLAHDSEEGPP